MNLKETIRKKIQEVVEDVMENGAWSLSAKQVQEILDDYMKGLSQGSDEKAEDRASFLTDVLAVLSKAQQEDLGPEDIRTAVMNTPELTEKFGEPAVKEMLDDLISHISTLFTAFNPEEQEEEELETPEELETGEEEAEGEEGEPGENMVSEGPPMV